MLDDIDSRIDGRMMAGTLVTGNFFQALGVTAALGRTLTPDDDKPFAGRPVVVLSHRGWSSRFASDPAVIGRSLLVNGFSYDDRGRHAGRLSRTRRRARPTTGRRSRSSVSSAGIVAGGREDAIGIDIVGRLKPGLSRQTALAGLAVWDSGHTAGGAIDRRRANITLEPTAGNPSAAGWRCCCYSRRSSLPSD